MKHLLALDWQLLPFSQCLGVNVVDKLAMSFVELTAFFKKNGGCYTVNVMSLILVVFLVLYLQFLEQALFAFDDLLYEIQYQFAWVSHFIAHEVPCVIGMVTVFYEMFSNFVPSMLVLCNKE